MTWFQGELVLFFLLFIIGQLFAIAIMIDRLKK